MKYSLEMNIVLSTLELIILTWLIMMVKYMKMSISLLDVIDMTDEFWRIQYMSIITTLSNKFCLCNIICSNKALNKIYLVNFVPNKKEYKILSKLSMLRKVS